MIDIQYCEKCERAYDFSECPFCLRKIKLKEKREAKKEKRMVKYA